MNATLMRATDAVRDLLRAEYGARAFAELVEPEHADPYVLVLSQKARELATRLPAVRDSGLSVTSIRAAPRVAAALTGPISLWTAAHAGAALADELLPTEIVETAWQPAVDCPRPVVIGHDFTAYAPEQVGWLHRNPPVQPLGADPVVRPTPESVKGYARRLLGTRYLRSAKTGGLEMDCSGFVWVYVYHSSGLRLPRLARWQALATEPTSSETVTEGDLVLFSVHGQPVHHAGLVAGNADGRISIAHCSSRAGGVTIEDLGHVAEGSVITFGRLRAPEQRRTDHVPDGSARHR